MILVEAGASPQEAVAEASWLCSVAAETPGVLGVIISIDWNDPARIIEAAVHPMVVGARITVYGARPTRTTISNIATTLSALSNAGLSADILCSEVELSVVQSAVSRVSGSGARVVVDHATSPDFRDDVRLVELVDELGVFLKLSGRGLADATPAARRESLRWATSTFPSTALMLGSDWPVSRSAGRQAYAEWMSDCGPLLSDQLRWATALHVYRPPAPDGVVTS